MSATYYDKCPDCGNTNLDENEYSGSNDEYIGCLFAWCKDCGWDESEEYEDENDIID